MAGGSAGAGLSKDLTILAEAGVVGDLSDGQLLQRFVAGRGGPSEAAFAALVGRHGPMVLRVCRQVVGDPHDAQDAFQATFLVLARKAGSVREAESVASWLHGVALRVGGRARTGAARRKAHERRAAAARAASPDDDRGRPDAWPELHEELARLPGRLREPVVLCYLEGLTTEAAAARLGCPRGTVLSRLSRARDRLRDRLARRGLAPAPALASLADGPPPATPSRFAEAARALTDLGAARLAAGGPLGAGTFPASVLTLTAGALHAMTLARIKTAAALAAVALLGMTAAGAYAFQNRDGSDPAPPAAETVPRADPPAADPFLPASPRADPPAGSALPGRAEPARLDPRPIPTIPPVPSAPPAADPAAPDPAPDLLTAQELTAQLALARRTLARYEMLRNRGAVPQQVVDDAEGKVRVLEARAAGRSQQLEEDIELLKIRLEVKRSELRRAEAQAELSKTVVTLHRRLNERVRGSVAPEDAAKGEAEFRIAVGGRDARAAEVREIEARIRHAQRRLAALAPLLKPNPPAGSPGGTAPTFYGGVGGPDVPPGGLPVPPPAAPGDPGWTAPTFYGGVGGGAGPVEPPAAAPPSGTAPRESR